MLEPDPVSLGNSQNLMLRVAQETPVTPGFASGLSLSVDHSQESDTGMKKIPFW